MHTYGKGHGCTNEGITEYADTLIIQWGIPSVEDADSDTDLVLCDGSLGRTEVIQDEKHLRRVIGSAKGYVKAVTTSRHAPKGNTIGAMAGGNYVKDSNGMFRIVPFPVPVHDRYETPEQYDMLSG